MMETIKELISEDVVASMAVLISLCALFLTFWQGYLTRKHNILSVKPYLDFSWGNIDGEYLNCEIKNHGLGAAFLDEVTYFIKGEKFPIQCTADYVALFQILGLDKYTNEVKITHIQQKSAIAPSSTLEILSFLEVHKNKELHQKLASKLGSVEVQVSYKCIYGKSYESSKSGLLKKVL